VSARVSFVYAPPKKILHILVVLYFICLFRSLGVNLSDFEVLSQGWRRDAKVVGVSYGDKEDTFVWLL